MPVEKKVFIKIFKKDENIPLTFDVYFSEGMTVTELKETVNEKFKLEDSFKDLVVEDPNGIRLNDNMLIDKYADNNIKLTVMSRPDFGKNTYY